MSRNHTIDEGIGAAEAGQDVSRCPYDGVKGLLWRKGYYIGKPCAQTTVEDILMPALGGPLYRSPIVKYEVLSYEEFPFSFWKPENYTGKDSTCNQEFKKRLLGRGVYDLSNIPYAYLPEVRFNGPIGEEGFAFVQSQKKDNIYLGLTSRGTFLLAKKPKKIVASVTGDIKYGFVMGGKFSLVLVLSNPFNSLKALQ